MVDKEKARTMVYMWAEILRQNGFEVMKNISVRFNKSYRNFGSCLKTETCDCAVITLSEMILSSTDIDCLQNTIIHELLHAVKGCIGHGEKWLFCACKVETLFGIHIQKYGSAYKQKCCEEYYQSHVQKYKYACTCANCSHTYKYKRETMFVREVRTGRNSKNKRYSCGSCGCTDFIFSMI